MTRQEIEAANQAAQEAYNVHGMETCEFCGRTFAEGRLAIHNKSCRADNISKKAGDGAAPRNKKESEVDYGRVRTAKADNSSRGQIEGGSLASSAGTIKPIDAGSGGGRPLTGSLASNRRREVTGTASRPQTHSSIEQSVNIDSSKQVLQGKDSMISSICEKIDRWEATTNATLQEIRDLKDLLIRLSKS